MFWVEIELGNSSAWNNFERGTMIEFGLVGYNSATVRLYYPPGQSVGFCFGQTSLSSPTTLRVVWTGEARQSVRYCVCEAHKKMGVD